MTNVRARISGGVAVDPRYVRARISGGVGVSARVVRARIGGAVSVGGTPPVRARISGAVSISKTPVRARITGSTYARPFVGTGFNAGQTRRRVALLGPAPPAPPRIPPPPPPPPPPAQQTEADRVRSYFYNQQRLRTLDFQVTALLEPPGDQDSQPTQWDSYAPQERNKTTGVFYSTPTCGLTLGSPGRLPDGVTAAARFEPELTFGRPRSMAHLSQVTALDPDVTGFDEPTRDPADPVGAVVDGYQGTDRWYFWRWYFPLDFMIPDSVPPGIATVLCAWHNQSSIEKGRNPNLQWQVENDLFAQEHLYLRILGGRTSATAPTTWTHEAKIAQGYQEAVRLIDFGPITRGSWIEVAQHTHWSPQMDEGLVDVWVDGARATEACANLYFQPGDVLPEKTFINNGIYMPNEGPKSSYGTPGAYDRAVWQHGFQIRRGPRLT